MKINSIQINGFGNLENKELKLNPKLNIISGKNESGKSTMVYFIKSIFYGIDKNKSGNEFSEYERFKPWNANADFSGKIEYDYDNNKYTVIREFNKNNCRVYNYSGDEITKDFSKDKSRGAILGNNYFEMDEQTFVNTALSCQTAVDVDITNQKYIIQKLSNMIQNGDESISYEKAKNKIEKILQDEVGTDRTQNKPKNVLNRKISDEEASKNSLISNKIKSEELNDKLTVIQTKKENLEKDIDEAREVYDIKSKYKNLYIEKKNAFDEATKIMERENNQREKNKRNKIKNMTLLLIGLLLILLTLLLAYSKFLLSGIALSVGVIGILLYRKLSNKDEKIDDVKRDFTLISEELKKKEEKEIDALKQKKMKDSILERKSEDLKILISGLEKNLKDCELEEHKYKIERDILKTNVNKLNEVEEQLALDYEEREKLQKYEDTLKLALEVLRDSYEQMKDEIIPSINKKIQENILKMTNGKYMNVIYNDNDGLLVENSNGEWIRISKLSMGTIDQMYFGFRNAMIFENKHVPIILDEAFVYSDNERLENILKALNEISKTNQVILFTCSDREKNILDRLGIEYGDIAL